MTGAAASVALNASSFYGRYATYTYSCTYASKQYTLPVLLVIVISIGAYTLLVNKTGRARTFRVLQVKLRACMPAASTVKKPRMPLFEIIIFDWFPPPKGTRYPLIRRQYKALPSAFFKRFTLGLLLYVNGKGQNASRFDEGARQCDSRADSRNVRNIWHLESEMMLLERFTRHIKFCTGCYAYGKNISTKLAVNNPTSLLLLPGCREASQEIGCSPSLGAAPRS
eukprot:2073235-Pleurochrysis_carterae.AAC.1